MFNYNVFYQKKGTLNWTPLDGYARPFSMNDTLDESLDSGVIQITGLSEPPAINPFAGVRIDITDGVGLLGTRYFRAGTVKTVKRRYEQNSYLYDVQIDLVEPTKDMERVVVDTMTCTNYLGKDYASAAVPVIPTFTYNNPTVANNVPYDNAPYIYSQYALGTSIEVPPTQDKFGGVRQPAASDIFWKGPNVNQDVTVTSPSGNVVYSQTATADAGGNLNMQRGSFIAAESGVYIIKYTGYCEKRTLGGSTQYTYEADYKISAVKNLAPKTDWTIASVVNRLLAAGKTRRNGIEVQKYWWDVNSRQEEKYERIKAPEFYFTRSTLFDALLAVGGAIHAIPRLVIDNDLKRFNRIRFTPLGGNTVKAINAPMIYEEREYSAEDYCGAFDSIAENMINTVDRVQGAVLEPSARAYKTVRCVPSETKINADTMCVLTDFPIDQVTGLWVSVIHDGTQYKADLTPYVFEKAEYDNISDYKGAAYPYSKAYALCYQKGDNKITGLNFTIKQATGIDALFTNYAIYNIIKEVLNITLDPADYVNLGFRVRYIPVTTARIKQLRPTTSIKPNNELIYNQSGNSVESSFYGEKLRGAAARLGNETVTRTYAFDTWSDIPRAGDLVDVDGVKMYVAIVNMQCGAQYIRATLVMTPNYNKLSEWVGINSSYRLYDVSEKQSVERLMNYGEVCVIGTAVINGVDDMHPLINDWGIKHIKNTFSQTIESGMSRPRCALLLGLDDNGATVNGELISAISLPLSSGGSGSSLYFTFKYMDNYGAGYQALDYAENITIENKHNRILRNVPYGDVYGEVQSLAVVLRTSAGLGLAAEQTDYDGGANTLPKGRLIVSTGDETFSTGDLDLTVYPYRYPRTLIVQKDSREQLNVTIQQHFQVTTPDIVIGKALTQDNLLITDSNSAKAGVLYLLTEPLNLLRQTLDLTGAYDTGIAVAGLLTASTNLITLASFTVPAAAPGSYKSWAIVNPSDKTFYIGKNEDLTAGDVSSPLYFNFTDNSYFDGYAQ